MGRACGNNGREENCIYCWWGNLRETDHLEDLDVVGRIILKFILKKIGCGAWTVLIQLRLGLGGRFCEHGNESLGSITSGEFLE